MQKAWSAIKTSGFSVVEVLLASTIFGLLITGLLGAFLYGQESTALGGERGRATILAQEGLEATRNIRDDDFANLIDGNHGISISGNQWIFSGTSDVTGVYTRQVNITAVDSTRKQITSTVTWQQNEQRAGLVVLTTYLTAWAQPVQQSGFVVNIDNANIGGGGNKELRGLTVSNTGQTDATIDKITVTWDNNQLIDEIKIDNDRIWKHNNEGTPNGRQPSGTELDVDDFTVAAGTGPFDINKIKFNGDMTGAIFTILFTLSDSSTHEVTVDLSGGSCGDQADSFVVDTSSASIGGGGNKELKDLTIDNTDNVCPVTIQKMTVTWTNSQLIEEIKIDNDRIWKHNNEGSPDGRQPSGTEIDVEDFDISGTDGVLGIDKIKFNGNMTGVNFTILFTFGDATTKLINVDFVEAIAPNAVSDLSLSGAASNSIDLDWTAPGDDGGTGTAITYDVRYSTSLITELDWASATQATGEPSPSVAGFSESMTVSGLIANTTYYFAIKTSDEIPNESAISNVPNLTTLVGGGTQADDLTVDISGANIGGGGKKELRGITVENINGSDAIVIQKITLTWGNGRLIQEIKINGDRIWKHNNEGSPDGRQPTGTEIDVEDHDIPANTTHTVNKFKFNGNMNGDTFTITFTMGDSSTKVISSFSP